MISAEAHYLSLLQSDCQVHLQAQMVPANVEQYMTNLLMAVLPSMLRKFRMYLSLLRLMDYSISDEVTKVFYFLRMGYFTGSEMNNL